MSQSDINDELHLSAPTRCIQMSPERQGEDKEGGREADRGRGESVQLSQTAGDVQLSRRLDYSLKSAL